MKKMIAGGLAALAAAGGLAYAASAYADQTHRASNHLAVEARGGGKGGGKGDGEGGGKGGAWPNPNNERPNEGRGPGGQFIHDGLPGV